MNFLFESGNSGESGDSGGSGDSDESGIHHKKTFAFVNVMFQIIKGGKYGIALITRSLENVTSSLCFTRVSLLLLCENVRFPVIV